MGELRTPGDLLLHPVSLAALGLVILNDRVLKQNIPGPFTGKLSDFAGLVYFPLLVVAFAEAVRWLTRRRPWELRPSSVEVVVIAVGIAFSLMKTLTPAADFYRSTLGYLLWPIRAVGDVAQGHGLPKVRRVDIIEDRTDLVALIALAVPIWIGRSVMRANPREAA
jgi:hypothetical protein